VQGEASPGSCQRRGRLCPGHRHSRLGDRTRQPVGSLKYAGSPDRVKHAAALPLTPTSLPALGVPAMPERLAAAGAPPTSQAMPERRVVDVSGNVRGGVTDVSGNARGGAGAPHPLPLLSRPREAAARTSNHIVRASNSVSSRSRTSPALHRPGSRAASRTRGCESAGSAPASRPAASLSPPACALRHHPDHSTGTVCGAPAP
jgi:hypothetical protein